MRKAITATIITIGDELLIGQVIDTNSAYIAQKLNAAGIIVRRRVAVGDNFSEIIRSLDEESKTADIIITTGGLGPTADDITKETLAAYFNCDLVINQEALDHVYSLFRNVYHKEPSAVNLDQAKVPEGCEVLLNRRGSAPAMIFQKERTYIISIAGVPYEMEGIIEDLIPWLQLRFRLPQILHRTVITAGIGESDLAEKLQDFEKKLPATTTLAYLPGPAGLRLRLTSVVNSKEEEAASRKLFTQLKRLTAPYLTISEDIAPEVVIGRILKKKKKTVATAESCTGGRIASLITSIPGSSDYYSGSVVSYSNLIKEKVLGVKKVTLQEHGAVSEQVVIEMLKGVIQKMNTTYGVAVSGIMGPGGGSAEKPVGTVWMAAGSTHEHVTQKIKLHYDRKRNIDGTSARALYLLKTFLDQEAKKRT